jgi:hypothetical protein
MVPAATDAPGLEGMLAASPETLGRSMLEADPHAWRLDRATQSAAVAEALADGAAVAEDFRARFAGLTAQAIARELAVPIEITGRRSRSARSGDLPNIGSGRPASCSTAAGSRHWIWRWSTLWQSDCSGARRRKTSLSLMSFSITPKPPDRTPPSLGATGRLCSGLAAGIGAPALRRYRKSRPERLRSRCLICPAIPGSWISSQPMRFADGAARTAGAPPPYGRPYDRRHAALCLQHLLLHDYA